ncbi:MAG: hypothetical protein ACI31M_00750 [Bacilli bacterium]
MKKIIGIILSLLLIAGCGCMKKMTAKEAVEGYLERYRTQDETVIKALDEYIALEEEITDKHKEKYRNALIKQYKNIKYEINNESYDGDEATISVTVTVFDLYRAQMEANEYLNDHPEEFYDENNVYDKDLFMSYKLDEMNKYTDTVEYNIDFHVKKNKNDKWEVEPLSTEDLEKIHGIYHSES